MQLVGEVGPSTNADGVGTQPLRMVRTGELAASSVHGRYYEQSRRGNLFLARAVLTGIAGIASSNGIGGPLLWNGSSTINASILAVSVGLTVSSTVGAAIGIAAGTAQSAAPTTTTAIDSVQNCLLGGAGPAASTYRIGTVLLVPSIFFPLLDFHTGGLNSSDNLGLGWIDIGGCITVPPNTYIALAGSATATTAAATYGLLWEEVPI